MRSLEKDARKGIVEEIPLSLNCIEIEPFELDLFIEDKSSKSSRIKAFINQSEEGSEQRLRIASDIYFSFYKYFPKLVEKNRMDEDYLLNYGIIKRMMTLTDFKTLRSSTQFDEMISLVATEVMVESYKDTLAELMEELKEKKEEIEAGLQMMKEMKDLKKSIEEALSPEEKEKLRAENEEARAKMLDAYDKAINSSLDAVSSKLQESLDMTNFELKELSDVASGWGLSSEVSYQNLPYREKLKLIDSLKKNKTLQAISLLAGKLKILAIPGKFTSAKKKFTHIDSIEPGNNLERVLVSELGLLVQTSATDLLFSKKYASRELLQRKYAGKAKKGLGPIVICIDSSGSMRPNKEIYAKALALTLLDMAKRQKRSFYAIHFSSGKRSEHLKVNEFSKRVPYTIDNTIELASYFEDGGTDFNEPLKRCMSVVNTEPDFKKADIIFLTDGEAYLRDDVTQEFVAWKKAKNIKVQSVHIQDSYRNDITELEKFSDTIKTINDINKQGGDLAKDIIELIV